MIVLCFGNRLFLEDRAALDVGDILRGKVLGAKFVDCGTEYSALDEHLRDDSVVLDVVRGIKSVRLVDPDELILPRTVTAHDFDLAFYVKILANEGKGLKVIGIPHGMKARGAAGEVERIVLGLMRKGGVKRERKRKSRHRAR